MYIYILLFILPSIGLYWCKDKHKIVCVNTINECSSMHQWSIKGSYISLSENDINLIIKCAKETELVVGLPNGMNVTIKFDTDSKMIKVDDLMQKTGTNNTNNCNVTNCKLCSFGNSSSCIECNDRYYYSNISKTCERCSNPKCKRCDSDPSICSSYLNGYHVGGTLKRETCSANCKICNSYEICTYCYPNFYLDNGKCLSCQFCSSCNSYDGCTECWIGYYKDNKGCSLCDVNCLICLQNGCTLCSNTYYVEGKRCGPCTPNCIKCSGPAYNQCESCVANYFIKDGTCKQCDLNCVDKKCVNNTGCTECKEKYYVNDNMCSLCHTSCATCSGSNANNCLTCASGTYRNGFYCSVCDTRCTNHCDVVNGCTLCPDGFFIENKRCSQCNGNCKTCSSQSINCLSCNQEYYLQNAKCLKCSSFCSVNKCDPINGCTECKNGYYKNNMTCFECHEKCLTCDNGSSSGCLSCTDKVSYLVGRQCILCDTNCALNKCLNTTGCTQCNQHYFVNNKICSLCHETCLTCSNNLSNGCLTCEKGKYFDENRCVLCDENCENNTCDAVNGCQKCILGYFPDEKRCSQCDTIPNCLTCSQTNKNQCTSCKDTFIVVDNLCECPSHLYQNTSSTCDECYKNKTNCKLCRNIINFGIRCEECFPPFVTVNGNCIKCGINTTFIGNKCVNNTENCEIQNGQNECLKCQNEFYLQNKMCKPFEHKELCKTNTKITCEDCGNGITTTGNCEESICKYYYKNKTSTKCIQCNKHSNVNLNGICEENNKDYLYDNNVIFKCKEDQYLDNNNLCHECQDETSGVKCKMVNSKIHGLQCGGLFVINVKENKCFINHKCGSIDGNDCVSCVSKTESINENTCKNCVVEKCSFCQNDKCIVCVEEYLLTTTNECKTKEYFSCQKSHLNKCLKCEISFMRVDEIIVEAEYCEVIGNNIKYAMKTFPTKTMIVFECNEGFVLTNGSCKATNQLKRDENASDGCNIKTTKGCITCFNGYYRSDGTCHKCEKWLYN
ncbi:hypothetical protein EIN_133090, partial [Entamoeba invadens IP1]